MFTGAMEELNLMAELDRNKFFSKKEKNHKKRERMLAEKAQRQARLEGKR
jgi:hypothetical protein